MSTEQNDDEFPTRQPGLPTVIEKHLAAFAASLRTMMVGRVVRYDASKQLVDVKPLVQDFRPGESGQIEPLDFAVITNVPVQMMTAGGFTFTVPIVASSTNGTTGMLIFAERSLDRWLASSTGDVVDPALYHRFAPTDAVFVPGVLPFGAPMSVAPPTDHATAGSITGPRIHFRGSVIVIGDESGSKKIALDGDTVNGGTVTATAPPGGGAVVFTYTPAGGTPSPPSPTLALTGGKVSASATQAKAK